MRKEDKENGQTATPTWKLCVIAFLMGVFWVYATQYLCGYWLFIINLLHHNLLHHGRVRMIGEQPPWGRELQSFIVNSPFLALFLCLFWWGVKQRRWFVPLAFFLGAVACETCFWVDLMYSMKNFD